MEMLSNLDMAFNQKMEHVIYCMPADDVDTKAEYVSMLRKHVPTIQVIHGLPHSFKQLCAEFPESSHKLVIVDDIQNVLCMPEHENLMLKDSHHSNISVVITMQNYFVKGRNMNMMRQFSDNILFHDYNDRTVLPAVR